ncbi:hypothetical protein ABW19_dt0203619 [Dactylella cylindrospora]|nr:hypothetical protein ABW19_dt0203619 [Dactylella cylindrospora]
MSRFKTSSATPLSIPVLPLTPEAFSPFGSVIENPRTTSTSNVNQGTAAKYPEISPLVSYPPPSGKPSTSRLNLFVCNPRQLTDNGRTFTVHILERHPYTTQTFIPIGLDREDDRRKYLIIVAPTLPESNRVSRSGSFWRSPSFSLSLRRRSGGIFSSKKSSPRNSLSEVPTTNSVGKDVSGTVKPKGRGLPDLNGLKAFICRGDQAVTYGVSTWHAPMVVLGEGPIEFVVAMYENGVPLEDCEECDVEGGNVKIEVVKAEEEGGVRARL